MADTINISKLAVNTGEASYVLNAGGGGGADDIYAELGITQERFAELLARDFYCPLMSEAPTSTTFTYTDTDGSTNTFQIGQECRVPEDESDDYAFYKFMGTYQGSAVWIKVSSVTADLDDKIHTDLSLQDIYGKTIGRTTANCYVVQKPGHYTFPIAYGAAIKNGTTNAEAYKNLGLENTMPFVNYKNEVITSPYIEEDTNSIASSVELTMCDTESLIEDPTIKTVNEEKVIAFTVRKIPATGGNAVVSVMDENGAIMWSWHIWVWPDDLTPVTITNATSYNYNILPVNLGSKWDDASKTHIKNWFYQWGRPTPMLSPAAYNSTENATNYGVKEFAVSTGPASSFGEGIQNPNKFFINSVSPYNWFGTSSFYNLWDANCTTVGNADNIVAKTVYDPCPVGFKMPNGNTFTYFSTSNVVGSFNNGWYFKRNAEDTTGVFFPALGYRSNSGGPFSSVGSNGYVWLSSAAIQGYAYYLYFYSGNVRPQYSNRRASGFSVRPVQDVEEKSALITTIRLNQTITDPATMITRTVDKGGIEAIRSNSHRYTGKLNDAGVMELKQLDDTDGTKYTDGTAAELTTIGVDVWMKLPQFYYKAVEVSTDIWDISFAYGSTPQGDGWKFWDGLDLIGVYEAHNSSSKLYSVSGQLSSGNISQVLFIAYAHARGEGFTLVRWKHQNIMAFLFYTMYNHTNCQELIGAGVSSTDKVNGQTDSLGMEDTSASTNGNSQSINFWGLENWWGNKSEWMEGITVTDRVWAITEDDGTVRSITAPSTNGYISKVVAGEYLDVIPAAVAGSSTTGFCDSYYQDSGTRVVLRSNKHAASNGGVAYAGASFDSSYSLSSYGSRLAFRGNYVIT